MFKPTTMLCLTGQHLPLITRGLHPTFVLCLLWNQSVPTANIDCKYLALKLRTVNVSWHTLLWLCCYLKLLKGHCHAIWQLYKKLEGVFASIEFQNLWSSFCYWRLFWRYWNCFLSPVAMDGKGGNGLKLEKNGQFFHVLMLRVPKILKKLYFD